MFVPVQQRVLSPCLMSRLVSGDRKWFKMKVKKSDYSPIWLELNAFHRARWSRCLRARHFGVDGTQSNRLILGFVFPPSGIWCQFSEGFGPNCGWNVDHHSVHLSGQPRPYKNNLFSGRWNISPVCLFKELPRWSARTLVLELKKKQQTSRSAEVCPFFSRCHLFLAQSRLQLQCFCLCLCF